MRHMPVAPKLLVLLLIVTPNPAMGQGTNAAASPRPDRSHSAHGPAFNEGPRQVAWRMAGVGTAHFAVTTGKPEAQAFFDQGINLLHSFWYYEAERAFKHAAWLDPQCAMAYWGLAMAVQNDERKRSFLKIARDKATNVTDRERRYIDALSDYVKEGRDGRSKRNAYVRALEKILLAYPDDIEAKAFLAQLAMNGDGSSRVATEALIKEILAKAPEHPGAHHYRIHLWDGPEAEQAVPSCVRYPLAAPGIGHAQHMPGHIYAQLGRWDDAARAMEAAARVERRYFYDHGLLPFHSWNYAHDMHYLITILGYQGRVKEGIRLAHELLAVPRDPQHNNKSDGSAQGQGRFALMRMLVRFERWDEILRGEGPDWGDGLTDRGWAAYMRGLAHLGKGNRDEARKQLEAIEAAHAEAIKNKNEGEGSLLEAAGHELGGLLALADEKVLEAFERLSKAVELEKSKLGGNDPGPYPRPLIETLGRAHLQAKNWGLAEAVFRDALKRTPNSGPAFAGLAEALLANGKRDEAASTYAQLQAVWKYADTDLPAVRHARALWERQATREGIQPQRAQRAQSFVSSVSSVSSVATPSPSVAGLGGARWQSGAIEKLGPNAWEPSPAPDFELRDAPGKAHRLADYRGRNLILVFYLGNDCAHCMQQLTGLGKEMADLKSRDAAVLAVSAAPLDVAPATDLPFPLVADLDHAVARRYQAHDTFESRDLHATVFIDRDGRIRWYTVGSAPFTDWTFLKGEIDRVKGLAK